MKVFERPQVKMRPFDVEDVLTVSAAEDVSVSTTPVELPGDDFE